MKTKTQKGFTLVELLVVIAIIGILSTVAIVNLNSSRERAKEAVALQSIASYTTAAILCDNEGSKMTFPINWGPPMTYLGGQFCEVDINIDWPTPAELPEGYNLMYSTDINDGDGVWIYGIADTTGNLRSVICVGDPNHFLYEEGCHIQ